MLGAGNPMRRTAGRCPRAGDLAGLIDERASDANRHFGRFATAVENVLERLSDQRNLPSVARLPEMSGAAIGVESGGVGISIEAEAVDRPDARAPEPCGRI